MTPVEWPLRWIPRRSPGVWRAFAVTLLGLAAAIVIRILLLGPERGGGLSFTYLPALILVSLYAGPSWGFAMLGASLVLGEAWPNPLMVRERAAVTGLYAFSGAATVLISWTLRRVLLQLDEVLRRQTATEAELKASETRLRLAQDAGDVGFWDWDLVSGEAVWSPTLYRNLGLDPARQATVRDLLKVVHPDDRAMVREVNLTAIREGRMEPVEYRVIWPSGEVRWLLSRGETLKDDAGQVVRAVGVNIDVTDRRVAEQQVRESEARFRALANSAPVLMWVTRADGRREFANQAYVDFLGVAYQAALDFDWRKRLHPDDLDRILREQVAGEGSRKPFTLEARYRRGDGEDRWVRSFSQPRYGPTGAFEGFIGIGFDVTDAKQAQDDLRHINELLADRVAAALQERDEAEAALHRAQKLEAVGQLTGGVAHDFNNLLTVIIGALDLVQRRPDDATRRERMLEAALAAARRGERLTNQLLAFSRRQALKPELVRVDELLRESEPLLRRAVGEATLLRVECAAPGAVARIDPAQFEAAVMNLVVNARDAVAATGGEIRIESGLAHLDPGEVEETPGGEYLSVTVRDTGVGMDAALIARVFEPFFTTKEVGKGTGLGLSQVYGFARQSGGGVRIVSTPGQGAAVSLYLPRAEAAAQEPEAGPELREPLPGPSLRVLLVEDDHDVAAMVTAMLEETGHRVLTVEAAAPALAALRRVEPVDLMLTDVVMPGGMTGVELAREAAKLRPELPILLSSGYTGETLASAENAPWPLLRKPYSADALNDAIRSLLDPASRAA